MATYQQDYVRREPGGESGKTMAESHQCHGPLGTYIKIGILETHGGNHILGLIGVLPPFTWTIYIAISAHCITIDPALVYVSGEDGASGARLRSRLPF